MLYKKVLPALLAATVGYGVSTAFAEPEISANVSLTSDYRFRGISQSDDDPALQGGFDLAFDNGLYIGTWGSSVDFGGGDYGSLELDYYLGWKKETAGGVGFDMGYIYYSYPGDEGSADGDYQEIYGSVSFADITLGLAYSDDYYAESGDFLYYYADYSLGLADNISLDFHIGYNDFDEEGFLSDGADSYLDYSIALTATYMAVDFSLAWVGTDLDEEEYFELDDLIDDAAVFSISKKF
ncbi:MAG: TorF family putative porin [Parahaliea sp.]